LDVEDLIRWFLISFEDLNIISDFAWDLHS
jgi:hypothetical protein